MGFGIVERMFSALIGSLSMVEMRSVIACMRSWLLVLLRFSLRFLLSMSACDDPGRCILSGNFAMVSVTRVLAVVGIQTLWHL